MSPPWSKRMSFSPAIAAVILEWRTTHVVFPTAAYTDVVDVAHIHVVLAVYTRVAVVAHTHK